MLTGARNGESVGESNTGQYSTMGGFQQNPQRGEPDIRVDQGMGGYVNTQVSTGIHSQ